MHTKKRRKLLFRNIGNTNKSKKTMKKIRAAVVGYGNIGKYTIQALEAAPDFEIAGVVRRNGAADKPIELTPYEVVKDNPLLRGLCQADCSAGHQYR